MGPLYTFLSLGLHGQAFRLTSGAPGVYGRPVYELTGLGQRHFYFRSAAIIVWLAADEGVAESALAEVLDFYP